MREPPGMKVRILSPVTRLSMGLTLVPFRSVNLEDSPQDRKSIGSSDSLRMILLFVTYQSVLATLFEYLIPATHTIIAIPLFFALASLLSQPISIVNRSFLCQLFDSG